MGRIKMVLERTAPNLEQGDRMRTFLVVFEGCHLFFTTWARDFDTEVAN